MLYLRYINWILVQRLRIKLRSRVNTTLTEYTCKSIHVRAQK